MSSKLNIAGIIIASILIIALLFVIGSLKLNFFKFSPAAIFSAHSLETPLEWYQTEYPTRTDWNTASKYCSDLTTNIGTAYDGISWRLPTITELTDAHSTSSTTTPADLQDWFYWSSTQTDISTTSTSTSAYDLDMTSGVVSAPTIFNKTLPDDYAHCVRNVTIVPPSAPTNVSATAGNGQVTVSFTPPTTDKIYPVTYTVISSSTGDVATASGNSSPITVTSLTNGVNYTFTIFATNIVGTSTMSSSSGEVSPKVGGRGTHQPVSVQTWETDWDVLNPRVTVGGVDYSLFNDNASAGEFCVSVPNKNFISGTVTQADDWVYGGRTVNNMKWTGTNWELASTTMYVRRVKCNSAPLPLEWYANDTPSGTTDWYTASSTCAGLDPNGGLAWRLPTTDELQSKWGETHTNPTPGFGSFIYWTSDTKPDDNSKAYSVAMTNGIGGYWAKSRSNVLYARCVR